MSSGLYKTEMDPQIATEAAKHLSSILILDVPPGSQIAIDGRSFIASEKFKGFKLIPPGVHLVLSRNANQSAAAPVSFFVVFECSNILVKRWNEKREQLESLEDLDQEERLKLGVRNFDFDDGMAPYDLSLLPQWRKLSRLIDSNVVSKIMNGAPHISVAEEAQHQSAISPQSTVVSYTNIPLLIKRSGCSAAELSALNLDKTDELVESIKYKYLGNWKDMLGEIQFAFVAFMFGQSLMGLEQWKRLIHFILGCFSIPEELAPMFQEALRVLRHQIEFVILQDPTAADILADSFLKRDLVEFIVEMIESPVDSGIKRECSRMKNILVQKLGWEIGIEEGGEFAPVVVRL